MKSPYFERHASVLAAPKDVPTTSGSTHWECLEAEIKEQARMTTGPSAYKSWRRISKILSAHPDAWSASSDGTFLLWHSVLRARPTLLKAMLKRPPPLGLAARSPSGRGVWDALLRPTFASGLVLHASQDGLEELMKHVPVSAANDQGLVWVTPYPGWVEKLLKNVLSKLPAGVPLERAWLGAVACQTAGAREALVRMTGGCGLQSTESAAHRAQLLAQIWEREPGSLAPSTLGLLWAMQKLAKEVPQHFTVDLVSLREASLPIPLPGSWWEQARQALVLRQENSPRGGVSSREQAEAVLSAVFRQMELGANMDHTSAVRSGPMIRL